MEIISIKVVGVFGIFRKAKTAAEQVSPIASMPSGQRCYAIGDIHGRLDLLSALIAAIRGDSAKADMREQRPYLVFLGDYIDRGPSSRDVIELLIREDFSWAKPVFLKGNHEEAFVGALGGDLVLLRQWMGFGGMETCESYGLSRAAWSQGNPGRFYERLLRLVPPSHVKFVDDLYDSFTLGDYLFVHAGIRPGIAIDDQDPADLRWIRDDFLKATGDFGKIVVHGHTISKEPEMRANRIGIDTGAYRTDRLTALVLEGDEQRFMTAPVGSELASRDASQ